jgi:hypothetical protein
MPVFDRFQSARKEALPAAYLIPAGLRNVVDLLRLQGIGVDSVTKPWRAQAEAFRIDSTSAGPLFEGHRPAQAEGRWSEPTDTTVAAGWYVVRTGQALGVLAAYLLEPASEDGVVTWNLLDRQLGPSTYPILRVASDPRVPAVAVP